jgi:enterochelin esterase family protein
MQRRRGTRCSFFNMTPHHFAAVFVALMCTASFAAAAPQDDYKLGPDSQVHEGVPKGTVTKSRFTTSKIFPNTERDYWVYVPAQYKPEHPAALMVFFDGHAYADDKGQIRVPVVFDNLIAKNEMPVTVAVLINPGAHPDKQGNDGKWKADNRSFEYDTLSDANVRFVTEELLPEVEKTVKLTHDPDGRAICGMSSGGIAAFTAAWERPDSFRKVYSMIGSFTSIAYRPATDGKCMQPGGDLYPTLIRKTPIKPLRVFLQDGENDLDNDHGNWHLANEQMLAALNFANTKADKDKSPGPRGPRYDVNHAWGHGTHNANHGGAILPDVLRWLWREDKPRE